MSAKREERHLKKAGHDLLICFACAGGAFAGTVLNHELLAVQHDEVARAGNAARADMAAIYEPVYAPLVARKTIEELETLGGGDPRIAHITACLRDQWNQHMARPAPDLQNGFFVFPPLPETAAVDEEALQSCTLAKIEEKAQRDTVRNQGPSYLLSGILFTGMAAGAVLSVATLFSAGAHGIHHVRSRRKREAAPNPML